MTRTTFHDGRAVIHGLNVPGSRLRISAWIDRDGTLIDAEGFDTLRRPRTIAPDTPLWSQIAERVALQ